MAMKRIAAMLLTSVLLLSCVGCAQDGRKEPGAEKADLGLTAEVKPATDFTAKANAAIYDELDFDDKQEYEFATRGLIDAPEICTPDSSVLTLPSSPGMVSFRTTDNPLFVSSSSV